MTLASTGSANPVTPVVGQFFFWSRLHKWF